MTTRRRRHRPNTASPRNRRKHMQAGEIPCLTISFIFTAGSDALHPIHRPEKQGAAEVRCIGGKGMDIFQTSLAAEASCSG